MRDDVTSGSPPTDPTPDHPEHEMCARDPGALRGFDPALELPGMPAISSDFVERTWVRIQSDRQQISREADLLEDRPLPRALLDAYPTPAPSADFVAATLAALRRERAEMDSDADLRATLDAFQPPSPDAGGSGDLVERTLAALRLERTTLRIVGEDTGPDAWSEPLPEPLVDAPSRTSRWLGLAMAAAVLAAVTLGLSVFWSGGQAEQGATGDTVVRVAMPTIIPPSAEEFTPAPIGTAVARGDEASDVGARLGQADGLLLFAALAAGDRR